MPIIALIPPYERVGTSISVLLGRRLDRSGNEPMTTANWQSILVAVRDPHQRRQIAITKAANLAARNGAELTLFHAFSLPSTLPDSEISDPDAILRSATTAHREGLLELARPLRRKGISVRCEVVWDFPPAHAIIRHVLAEKPDLVVAESRRHARIARWFMANSDWELIRECPCPVWFVKHERIAKKLRILTAIDPAHAHAKPSALDVRLLRAAGSVADQFDGRCGLVHVIDTTAEKLLGSRAIAPAPAITDEIERLAKRHRIAAADRLIHSGNPEAALVSAAEEFKADLLVMGAVSRSGLSHFHIGSTAEAVIEAVTCDVLVVKPRQFKTTVSRRRPQLMAAGKKRTKSRRSVPE